MANTCGLFDDLINSSNTLHATCGQRAVWPGDFVQANRRSTYPKTLKLFSSNLPTFSLQNFSERWTRDQTRLPDMTSSLYSSNELRGVKKRTTTERTLGY